MVRRDVWGGPGPREDHQHRPPRVPVLDAERQGPQAQHGQPPHEGREVLALLVRGPRANPKAPGLP
ncbi:MAG: hypothetical protein L5656_10020 [Thermanaeromonas sp.]|nr:hypothetical protein [Thermanaeromonas sp.]